MKKNVAVIGAALLFALVAAAQDVPRFETFLGYDFTRANSATNVPAFSMNGGVGQVAFNFNHWIGFVADLGAVHNGNISGNHIDTTLTNFLFGPRVSIRKWSRVTPYFEFLWGGVYGASSTAVEIPVGTPTLPIVIPPGLVPTPYQTGYESGLRVKRDQTAFAMTIGGGLDIKINKHASFRPIGLEYFMTRLQNWSDLQDRNQNNLRYTAGVNFTFGAQ